MTRYAKCLLSTALLFLFVVSTSAATFTVTKTADTNDGTCDADCSLREAIGEANGSADNDVIVFDRAVFNTPQTIVLSGTEIAIVNNGSLTIYGPGFSKLAIDGNQQSRILLGSAGAVVAIDGLTFTRGNGVSATNNNSAGAIHVNAGAFTITNSVFRDNAVATNAGAIRNSGSGSSLTLVNCIFMNNTAGSSSGGALQNFSTSTLTISNSTFTGNSSGGTTGGGAMQANGQVRITNSTFSGNTAPSGSGGGIQSNGSLLLLTNVTITNNSSNSNGGGLHRGTTNVNGFVRNSIIAGNNGTAASPDVTNSTGGLNSEGNNIIGNVGTSTGWVKSDQQNVDPLLGPLAQNGGLGMTHALLIGSPALGAGDNCVVFLTCATNNPPEAVTIDQRAEPRVGILLGTGIDVGAYEVGEFIPGFLPGGEVASLYSFTIAPDATGFTYTDGGDLPPGVLLVRVGNEVSLEGIPTAPGDYEFTVTVTEDAVPSQTRTQGYYMNVSGNSEDIHFSGQFTNSGAPPLERFHVSLSSVSGVTLPAIAAPFGYFRIDNVVPGSLYTFSVATKSGDIFAAQFVPLGPVNVGDFSDVVPAPFGSSTDDPKR